MKEEIISLKNEAIAQITSARTIEEIERVRISYLGKSGKLSTLIRSINKIPKEERKEIGLLINDIKNTITSLLAEYKNKLSESSRNWIDPTIPGIRPRLGHIHLITQAIREIHEVFEKIGFVRARYPEVEWDWYAFESLNMPKNHPARDDWETFFVDAPPSKKYGQMVLTPHTSSGQVREMRRVHKPPIRMINIAKCYRRQSDVTHSEMFHQFEGLVVDKDISIIHLKGVLDYFAKSFFGEGRATRLRPYHFQFTEPSFEVDISCGVCKGKGILENGTRCKVCKSGWLELGGAGMVHPVVLANGGIDPTKYTGFAFGWGVERVMMMKSGLQIPDLRLLYSADVRFLSQF